MLGTVPDPTAASTSRASALPQSYVGLRVIIHRPRKSNETDPAMPASVPIDASFMASTGLGKFFCPTPMIGSVSQKNSTPSAPASIRLSPDFLISRSMVVVRGVGQATLLLLLAVAAGEDARHVIQHVGRAGLV